ncbi:MAG: phosphate/phosphite/phosphonate ABC transporter substrate-binding protein [Marinosulfonomonas sp.]|nr:phosphate/phosphite/phosphonate ABC transporter substrate-binding protein [Marinosulfonomonas sp.]
MIASLPMYDRSETAGSLDRFWQLIRAELGYGPQSLDRRMPISGVWTSPDLLLSQTCGLPYRTDLKDTVQLVGTFDYGLEGAEPGYYYSYLVTHASDGRSIEEFGAGRLAYNEADSQSGWAAAIHHAQAAGYAYGSFYETGSHINSARAVLDNFADIAAIDAQSWRLICRHEAFVDRLQVIGRTDPTPALPLITAPAVDCKALQNAISAAIEALSAQDRATLDLKGLVQIPSQAFLDVPNPPTPGNLSR